MKTLLDIQNQIAQANYKEDFRQLEYYQRENIEEDVCDEYALDFISYIFKEGFEFDYYRHKWINTRTNNGITTWTIREILSLYKDKKRIL